MFFFLYIYIDHFDVITENSSLDGKGSFIYYTKTDDILKHEDRSEIVEIMFYIAAVQTANFLYFFLSGPNIRPARLQGLSNE